MSIWWEHGEVFLLAVCAIIFIATIHMLLAVSLGKILQLTAGRIDRASILETSRMAKAGKIFYRTIFFLVCGPIFGLSIVGVLMILYSLYVYVMGGEVPDVVDFIKGESFFSYWTLTHVFEQWILHLLGSYFVGGLPAAITGAVNMGLEVSQNAKKYYLIVFGIGGVLCIIGPVMFFSRSLVSVDGFGMLFLLLLIITGGVSALACAVLYRFFRQKQAQS